MGFSNENNGFTMPVQPMYGNGNGSGNGFGFGGDGAWWLLVLLFALGGWNGNGNGFGNGNGGGAFPYYMMNNNTNSDVQRGFDQNAIITGIGNVQDAVITGNAATQQALCNGFAGVEAGATNRQMANMQQMFSLQQQLSQCCCDNRLATAETRALVLSENCEDRNALSKSTTDILINGNNNTQRLVDTMNAGFTRIDNKLCQLELDGYKQRLDEALARNVALENAAARANDRAIILADNAAQTQALEQYLRPQPNPAYIVQNPNCCQQNYGYGCGCAG